MYTNSQAKYLVTPSSENHPTRVLVAQPGIGRPHKVLVLDVSKILKPCTLGSLQMKL